MRALFGGAHCCDRLPRSLTTSSREGARRVRLARSSRRLTRVWRAAQTKSCTATRCCSAGGAQEQELGKDETRQAGRDASDARRRQRCGLRSPLTTKLPRPLTREPEPFPLIVRAKRPHHPARCGRYKAGHAEEGKDASVRLRPIQSTQCHIAGRRGAPCVSTLFHCCVESSSSPIAVARAGHLGACAAHCPVSRPPAAAAYFEVMTAYYSVRPPARAARIPLSSCAV